MSFNIDRLSEVGLSTTDACVLDYVLDEVHDSSERVLCVLKNAEQLHCVTAELERQRGATSFPFDDGRIGFTAAAFTERDVSITRNPPFRGEIWWVTPSWFNENYRGQGQVLYLRRFYGIYCFGGAELTAGRLIRARTIVKDGGILQGSSMSEFAAYITHRENILTNLDRLLGLVSPLPKETADVTTVLSPPEETEYVVSKELMSFIDSFKVI